MESKRIIVGFHFRQLPTSKVGLLTCPFYNFREAGHRSPQKNLFQCQRCGLKDNNIFQLYCKFRPFEKDLLLSFLNCNTFLYYLLETPKNSWNFENILKSILMWTLIRKFVCYLYFRR